MPLDEVLRPVLELRNETLFYSLAFLVFALPLYVTIVVGMIDRRLASRKPRFSSEEEE